MANNHANYQSRLDFAQSLLRERFGLQDDVQITPIQYDEDCPFKYNNFVYRVSLSLPIGPESTSLILRLANPDAEGMNSATRIENEVALISLAAAALAAWDTPVVPSVYGWGSAATAESGLYGWILQELMPGSPVDEAFEAMSIEEKSNILSQVARMLKALQEYKLPDTITDSFKGRLEVALRKADANPYIKGWHANGVRERIDAFINRGVPSQFETLASKEEKVIVHADLTANNILFDVKSGRVTALLDYDFACILHPSYEFLRSFDGAGGQFRGWSGDETGDSAALRNAKLYGFPSLLPQTKSGAGSVNWHVAKAWEDELERLDVRRPRTIQGIDKVADVDTLMRSILPWRVSNSDILRLQAEEVILKCRQENEKQLVELLSHLGF